MSIHKPFRASYSPSNGVERGETVEDTVFWNVDTQYDFMKPDGKLPVGEDQEGAEEIEDALRELTETAKAYGVTVVNTADYHREDTEELSDDPDFVETFPEHCMEGTEGAKYVEATEPENPFEVHWDGEFDKSAARYHDGDFVVYKDDFDVFAGEPEAPHTDELLDVLEPDRAIVYGVATDVCVDHAVEGLLERNIDVYVVEDAVKGLSADTEDLKRDWENQGAEIGDLEDVKNVIRDA